MSQTMAALTERLLASERDTPTRPRRAGFTSKRKALKLPTYDGGREGFDDWRLNVLRSLDSQHLTHRLRDVCAREPQRGRRWRVHRAAARHTQRVSRDGE